MNGHKKGSFLCSVRAFARMLGVPTNQATEKTAMGEQANQQMLSFAKLQGRAVEADFDGGTMTSDAGALLLRQAEAKVGIIDRVVKALGDKEVYDGVAEDVRTLCQRFPLYTERQG